MRPSAWAVGRAAASFAGDDGSDDWVAAAGCAGSGVVGAPAAGSVVAVGAAGAGGGAADSVPAL